MPLAAEVVENPEAAAQYGCASVHFIRHEASAPLHTEPMKGFVPQSLIRLQGRIVMRWACRRLARWCVRTARMKSEDFTHTLVQAVIHHDPTPEGRDPLGWLYRAMRDAAGQAGPLHDAAQTEHLNTYVQPFNVRLVAAINLLSQERYALLAMFMWGVRCEQVAEWQGVSKEDVATRIREVVRELAARVFGSRE